MKIAVCLRGHMRTYNRCISYIDNLRKNHDVDVFINTWEDYGFLQLTYSDNILDVGTINLNSGDVDFSNVIQLYRPVCLNIENYDSLRIKFNEFSLIFKDWYDSIRHDPTVGPARMYGFISQFYKESLVIQQCINYSLMLSKTYDVVIVTRPDVLLHIDDSILYDIQNSKDTLWANRINHDYAEQIKASWVCNSFFVGKLNSIEKLGLLYKNLYSIYNELYNEWKLTSDTSTYARMFCIHRLCWYFLTNNSIQLITDNRLRGELIR